MAIRMKLPPNVGPGNLSAVQASTEIIKLWKSGADWKTVKKYLDDSVYDFSETNLGKETGTNPRYAINRQQSKLGLIILVFQRG
ncbi:hypothetical protein CH371_18610 [Leptospira wolffii]|uniref:Uncharacterized protein n=1 Tax=Leptospira wolffii TaxID=409998 RepID=A0A2M9Z7L8_9LEPT|nr:hypothetical protein CH371_18610 [Leptospira wolffii]